MILCHAGLPWDLFRGPLKGAHTFSYFNLINWGMTNSQIRDTVLCRSVTKNLTAYRFNSGGWGLDDMKREIHSFPTMYIMGGVSGVEMGQN